MPQKTPALDDNDFNRLRHDLEVKKLEFEKEKEANRIKIENEKLLQAQKDTKTRLISSFLVTIVVTGGLTLFGTYYEHRMSIEAEKSRKAEMTIQLINAREKANNDLRANMFKTLIDFYQKDPNEMSSVLLLELIGLNFKDTVLLKPVFEKLYQDETSSDDQKKALRSASRKIVNDQLEAIRQSRDGEVCRMTLKPGETKSAWCFPPLFVTLIEMGEDSIKLRTNSNEGFIDDVEGTEDGDEFDVNYFDMPMIDYTVSSTGNEDVWRYSIVLKKLSIEGVTIAIAVLPQDSFSAQMPFRFDEMMSDYINPKKQGD